MSTSWAKSKYVIAAAGASVVALGTYFILRRMKYPDGLSEAKAKFAHFESEILIEDVINTLKANPEILGRVGLESKSEAKRSPEDLEALAEEIKHMFGREDSVTKENVFEILEQNWDQTSPNPPDLTIKGTRISIGKSDGKSDQ
mmetsp:Transcript_9947/g.13848  ORF Transcript_9947/g.13848 Transcript_9947/m.13848 type:complete len:144 (-) Transcript_9947:547-978(-)